MPGLRRIVTWIQSFATCAAVTAAVATGCAQSSSPSVNPTRPPLSTATTPATATQLSRTPVRENNPRFADTPECADVERIALPARVLVISDESRSSTVTVEVADTPEARSRGLMCRAEVPEGTGMAFQWAQPTTAGFWMYNTYVPLDLLYVNAAGRVVAVRSMTPCPRNSSEDVSTWSVRCAQESQRYAPGAQYVLAIELPGGWLGAKGFDPSRSTAWHVAVK